MLQVRLLGQFDVRLDGKRVTISSRTGQSLFAYLTLTAGTSHRREKLAGIIWPNTTEENARKNLRQELWRIRKALSAQASAKGNYLLTDDLTLKFNRHLDFWLDVTQIEKSDSDLQALITNLSLYQGELLPGFYDEWVMLERERIQAMFDARMEQLIKQLVTAEHWIAVQEWGERWLSLVGTREPAYRALMLATGARGDMAKAAYLYQRCLAELQEQLGVEPSAETLALYEGLVKGSARKTHLAAQPSSTITFLFTDIEGSTHLLERMGAQYAAVLSEHHDIIRKAIQNWNGHEVDTQGDAFFVTFPRAMDAVQCAAETQRALASHSWNDGEQVRVRMGLHTGEPLIASTGYVGMDVHRAARIGDAGHGGQVLLSQTTRDLVIQELPKDITIRDLGEYRLKDMKYPTAIYQLVIDGLPADFPPIRTKITGTEAPMPGKAPFKGLEYFDETDSDLFFGREKLTEKLVRRLKDAKPLSVIIGASGSGKSSLVRAGLIIAIKDNNPDWTIHIITPTAHPLDALAIELTRDSESVTATATLADDLSKSPHSLHYFLSRLVQRHGSPPHILLVIDQFEELFTLCRDEFEREAFIDNLLACFHRTITSGEAKGGEDCNLMLVITLRADFYAHLAQYPELRDAVSQQQEYIGPMTMDELHCAIEEPAKRGYWEFEPGLVDLILRDVGEEPGALPLLSHALLETWQRRAGHVLTLKGYADAGGVHGAIAHTADSVFNSMSSSEQAIMRNILLRLTEFGEGTEDTRRRASFDELMSQADSAGDVRKVLNKLAEARLVTLSEDTAEVAHEALIREWPQLREWLIQDREGIILHRHITESAHEWELLERDPGSLYHGARLAQANEWSTLNPDALNAQERLFLDESNRQAKEEDIAREEQRAREARLKQRVQRVLQVLAGVFLIAAIVSGGLAFWANSQRQEALRQASIGLASQARLELEGTSPERSVLLAKEALENYPYTWQAEKALGEIVHEFRLRHVVTGHTNTVTDMEWSPDGTRFATTSKDGILRIWDTQTQKTLLDISAHLAFDAGLWLGGSELAWSPDGKHIVTAGFDKTAKVWDVTSGQEIVTFTGHNDEVWGVAWSADGQWVASASKDGTARVWNAFTGDEKYSLKENTIPVRAVDWSPDGSHIATAGEDGIAQIWNADSGDEFVKLTGHTNRIWSATWSPNGEQVATASEDGTVRIWDSKTGTELFDLRLASTVWDVAWSPDGKQLATTNALGYAQVWDISARKEVFTLQGRTPEQFNISWSPDGKLLGTTAGADFSARIWDASPATLTLSGNQEAIGWVAWSPDGKRLLTVDNYENFTTVVWDIETGKELITLSGHSNSVQDASWSPDGTKILSTGWDALPRVWDANTGEILLTFTGHIEDPPGKFTGARTTGGSQWSPDGTRVMTGSGSGIVRIWDPETGEEYLVFRTTSDVNGTGPWSPDGKLIGTCAVPGILQIWDGTTGAPILGGYIHNTENETHGGNIDWCMKGGWSPDGKKYLTASTAGNGATIWDIETGEKILVFLGHSGGLGFPTWSPNGQRVASGDLNGDIKIWDAETGVELLSFKSPIGIFLFQLAWSPDGKYLTSANASSFTDIFRIWQTTEDMLAYTNECCVVRELTPEERQQFGLLQE